VTSPAVIEVSERALDAVIPLALDVEVAKSSSPLAAVVAADVVSP
jgi:hypothetical protein